MFANIGKFKKYVGKKFYILTMVDEKFAVDSATKQKDGGEIHIWDRIKDCPNQIWTVDCMGHLMLAGNPKAVLYTTETADNTRICITGEKEIGADAYDALARWTLTKEGEIHSQHNPDQMLNLRYAKATNGAQVICYHKQGADAKNDKWKIEVVGDCDVAMPAHDLGELSGLVDATFMIRSLVNEKFAVDSANKQKVKEGGEPHIWDSGDGKNRNQYWTLDKQGHIVHADNKEMALVPVKCAENARVVLVRLTKTGLIDAPIAKWTMNKTGEIVNCANPSLVLNLQYAEAKNGAKLILYPRQKTDAKNDKWKITKV